MMKTKQKRIICYCLTLALITVFVNLMVGCSRTTLPPTLKPEMTSATTANSIITKTLSEIARVNSYELNSDVVNTYKLISDTNTASSITEWKGTKLVNISTREMGMNMSITDTYSGTNMDASLEMYLKDGNEYLKTVATGLSKTNPWEKTQLSDTLWNHEIQLPLLTELLNTATQLSLLENEKVNEKDCYVLAVTPTTQAIIDWVVSQSQPYGPQIDVMNGGGIPVVRPDAYQTGSVKIWIDKDSYLPIQVEINTDFQGNVGGGSITASSTPYTPATNPVASSFVGHMSFSNFNQPLSIQVPQEAISATVINLGN